jgi:agmatine deiminase
MAPFATVVQEMFGDIWLRDTGPLILKGGGDLAAASFGFNGWGGKYDLEGDDTIGLRLAETAGLDARRHRWILEGGAIDVDGTGLAVTTEQCLLNRNRNPELGREEIEARLRSDLGIERLLWLGEGLLNDHTDGPASGRPALARAGRARWRDHPGFLYELLHRQCGRGGPHLRRGER